MHYGLEIIPFGAYSDPRAVVRLAQATEAAGWEAIALGAHTLVTLTRDKNATEEERTHAEANWATTPTTRAWLRSSSSRG